MPPDCRGDGLPLQRAPCPGPHTRPASSGLGGRPRPLPTLSAGPPRQPNTPAAPRGRGRLGRCRRFSGETRLTRPAGGGGSFGSELTCTPDLQPELLRVQPQQRAAIVKSQTRNRSGTLENPFNDGVWSAFPDAFSLRVPGTPGFPGTSAPSLPPQQPPTTPREQDRLCAGHRAQDTLHTLGLHVHRLGVRWVVLPLIWK